MAVTITQEDVKKARDYLPAETKEALTRLMAKLCTRVVENDASTEEAPLPPYRVEDRLRRLQCLNGVLCAFYFGGSFEKEKLTFRKEDGSGTEEREIEGVMSLEALNDWCEGHPRNQLERLKKEKNVANKVYDILDDFKLFEILLDRAIREEIEMQNDPAIRIAQMLAMQMNPGSLKETLEEIQQLQKGDGKDA
jgi:hypothetical protein